MRILFIHGFGENEAIFSKIAPHISGEHIFLNAWTLLGDTPRPTVNVLDFAKEIVQKYAIKITVTPDLRIHALKDLVVRPPRESFHKVIGDHFTLYTHPELIYEPIVAFLNKKTLTK